jgi:hypothetical protein
MARETGPESTSARSPPETLFDTRTPRIVSRTGSSRATKRNRQHGGPSGFPTFSVSSTDFIYLRTGKSPFIRLATSNQRHACEKASEGFVKKTFITARNIIGVAGLILAGYVVISSLPDVGRYIKISSM